MNGRQFQVRMIALLSSAVIALAGMMPVALAGPGLTPATSNTGASVLAPTFYANSPQGLRPDLVTTSGPGIDTGTAMRKFVDVLPGIPGLAPSTNAGTGTMPNGDTKYIPLAVPGMWPGDMADYYHLAVVEYTEQMHSDLPKATTLRGYVQIEEPGVSSPHGSLHVPLYYPNGAPIRLPDAGGTLQQVYGYDKPHYLGPTILATRNVPTRIKWSNLLPPGGFDEVTGQRNGDLPIPVDATLAGGALQQNRAEIHLHGGLSPWISDGTPHQWTIPVGDTRYGAVTDIAVTAVGARYTSIPVVRIDPPQGAATGTAVLASTGVASITVTNAGAGYSVASPPTVTITGPSLPAGSQATATATMAAHAVTRITAGAAGTNYAAAPLVTVSAPPASVTATATASLAAGSGVAASRLATLTLGVAGGIYTTAPTVTIAAPPVAVQGVGTATLSGSGVGSIAAAANFGYWAAPTVTLAAPPAAVNATATATLTSGAVTAVAVNSGNYGYFTAPTLLVAAPPAVVQATATATMAGGSIASVAVNGTNAGYATAPVVTVAAPTAAVQATATPTLSAGMVTALAVNGGNFGYFTAPSVTFSAPAAAVPASSTATVDVAGVVTAISVNDSNFGYFTAPSVTISAPAGVVAAVATPTVSAATGTISAVAVNGNNFGYYTVPVVGVPAPPATTGATATATLNATHGLASVAVNAGNYGYWSAPTVTVPAAPAAVQATASMTLNGSSLGAISVGNAGYGYWTAPAVTVSSPTGAGSGVPATARPTISATGAISALAVNAGNSGYIAAPTVTIPAPRAAVNAVATPTVNAATFALSAISVSGTNFGYWTVPTITVATPTMIRATATVTTGKVVTLTNAGFGYLTAPVVTVTGGTRSSGTAWTATATVTNRAVTVITVSGTGVYSVAPTLSLATAPAGTRAVATATIANGRITAITLTNAGAGYNPAVVPVITVTLARAGTRATATATLAAGAVSGYTVTAAGIGYDPLAPPTITVGAPTGGGTSVQATATAAVANGAITGYTITNAGSGYVSAPSITIAPPTPSVNAVVTPVIANGRITSYSVTAGSNYLVAPALSVSAATAGTQASATAAIANGAITAISVAGGAGYDPLSLPLLTVAAPSGAGTAATATPLLSNGVITGFTISGGLGYSPASPPTVTIAPPTPSVTATATATILNGAVTAYNITAQGANYVVAPTATVAAPSASVTALVSATVAGGKVTGYTINTAGTNYLTAPTITVGAPVAGTQAVVTANVANGAIASYTIATAGTGYSSAPVITVPAAPATVRAVASANVAGGMITGFAVTTAGSGYAAAPAVTIAAPTASVAATGSATINATTGAVSGVTLGNVGSGYAAVPAVTLSAPPVATTATVTALINATTHVVSSYTLVSGGAGYVTTPTVTVAVPYVPAPATAVANVAPDGTIGGFRITSAGAGYATAPVVTIGWPARAVQATATATVAGGALTSVTITNEGSGYLSTPRVTLSGGGGSGATISALISLPVGVGFRQVPDMIGTAVGPAGYTPPMVGEGTLYYTNQQSERLMWYHDHTSGTTRLNAYMGEAAPYLILDAATQGPLTAAGLPGEIIPLVIQDKTFVPKDIMLEDANWDTRHWGQPGDLWFPHVYETNQNPSFLGSASQAGRWDWGPWFAVVYPAMYALPSGKYGDVTTTPEAFMDTALVNGVAYPTLTVQPKAYRFLVLNGANDRFLNLGLYLADPLQVAADGRLNTEVLAGASTGDQPGNYPGNVFADSPLGAGLMPWPTDGHWAPLPSEMGPPMYQIGNEAGMLPHWVQQDAIPVNYEYNRRSVTVLNVGQDNDSTLPCFPKCHGLYIGGAERADVVIDFSQYAGKTLILYNDSPAPNPGFDPRIDYYSGNDPGNAGNYPTGGAPNTEVGYGPNTRTIMQIIVQSSPVAAAFDPRTLGAGRVLGTTVGAFGALQSVYVATQPAPIVGEAAYNVAFNAGYTDQYADMFLASQNEPMFFVTSPGALTLTGIAVTGQTTATGAASGVGTNNTGSNSAAGSGTGYLTAPTIQISAPSACVLGTTGCAQATATAVVANGEVASITLTDPGAGYTAVPMVNVEAAYTVGALGLTNAGAGYLTAPNVTISGGNGAGATATATISGGLLTGLTLTNPGAGYTGQPTVAIDPPPALAAWGTAALTADAVSSVGIGSPGSYLAGVVPTVMFAPPPAKRAATISAAPFSGICCVYTIVSAGSGYTASTLALTVTDPTNPAASGAVATATLVNGSVVSVAPTAVGTLNYFRASVAVPAPTGTATLAHGTALMDGAGTQVIGVALSSGGSGYYAAPGVTFSGGLQATAQAALTGGGTGATAVALTSRTTAFVVPAAMPRSGVPLSTGAVPVLLPAGLATLMGCNAAQTTCTKQAAAVVGRLMNPAIQELFEPFYGRMNATLGIEMPNQSLKVQTTLPLNYIDPATEQLEPNTVQMWKITHNGVDAHPVHFHLVNVQVLNRMGWDGTVKPPEDNEIGWKETVKMNPLEDIVVAMRAEMPKVPFGLDRSIRAQDPSQPLGVNMGFTQFYIAGLNGTPVNGLVIPAGAMPAGLGVGDTAALAPVVNSIEDYDNEYVWHCHILGHEENDFMRALVATSQPTAPDAPTGFAVTQAGAGLPVVASWVDPTPLNAPLSTLGNAKNEIGFKLERCVGTNCTVTTGTWLLVANVAANTTTGADPLLSPLVAGTVVYYRVYGYNAATVAKVIGGTNTGLGAKSIASLTVH